MKNIYSYIFLTTLAVGVVYLIILFIRLRGLKSLFTNAIKEKLKGESGTINKLERLIELNITDNEKNIFYIKNMKRLRYLVYLWIIILLASLLFVGGF